MELKLDFDHAGSKCFGLAKRFRVALLVCYFHHVKIWVFQMKLLLL